MLRLPLTHKHDLLSLAGQCSLVWALLTIVKLGVCLASGRLGIHEASWVGLFKVTFGDTREAKVFNLEME